VRREAAVSGIEWMVDAQGCDPARLADLDSLKKLFDAIVSDLSLRVVGDAMWHVFPTTSGITGLSLLAESHLTVHTFPEHGSLCLNLFCCRPRPEWNFTARLAEFVGAESVSVRRAERNYVVELTPS
jgi:S-adenosylmethionine decarboxylase